MVPSSLQNAHIRSSSSSQCRTYRLPGTFVSLALLTPANFMTSAVIHSRGQNIRSDRRYTCLPPTSWTCIISTCFHAHPDDPISSFDSPPETTHTDEASRTTHCPHLHLTPDHCSGPWLLPPKVDHNRRGDAPIFASRCRLGRPAVRWVR